MEAGMSENDRPYRHHSEAELLEARRNLYRVREDVGRQQIELENLGDDSAADAKFEQYNKISDMLSEIEEEFRACRSERSRGGSEG
jgi:hypothetical protein